MKKLFILLIISIFVFACDSEPSTTSVKYRMDVYENMVPPIIVVGHSERIVTATNKKGEAIEGMKGSILLQDSKGTTVTFTDTEPYGISLIHSYSKGDTLLTLIK